MATYFLLFEGEPSEESDLYGKIGGAFLCCYTLATHATYARHRCQEELLAEGWIITDETHNHVIVRDDLSTQEDLERFDQAQLDGFCCTAQLWPLQDGDEYVH